MSADLTPEKASAAARELAFALPLTLNPEDARDLLALLEYRLAVPSARERRHDTLGLIIRVIAATGQLPGHDGYDRAHREATAQGEQWPSRSALRRAYGKYEQAELAAARFLHMGSAGRVPDSYRHATNRPSNGSYAASENGRSTGESSDTWRLNHLMDAVDAFRQKEGEWPEDEWEFLAWAAHERRCARDTGQPPPMFPERQNLLALGPFENLLSVTKARYEASSQLATRA